MLLRPHFRPSTARSKTVNEHIHGPKYNEQRQNIHILTFQDFKLRIFLIHHLMRRVFADDSLSAHLISIPPRVTSSIFHEKQGSDILLLLTCDDFLVLLLRSLGFPLSFLQLLPPLLLAPLPLDTFVLSFDLLFSAFSPVFSFFFDLLFTAPSTEMLPVPGDAETSCTCFIFWAITEKGDRFTLRQR